MKQFKTILAFELKSYFKNKIFVGITLFLVALIAVLMFFPRAKALLGGNMEGTKAEELPVMLIAAGSSKDADTVKTAFASAFPGYEVCIADGDLSFIEEQITSGDAECAFVMESLSSYIYYVNNLSMYDENTAIADEVLKNLCQANAMADRGISPDEAGAILSVQIEHDTASLGKDQMQNFFYTYIMIFALYMVILLYGQMVATNVATEKSSRAMEVLITSASPTSMMFGKVLASCLAGLLQLTVVFGSGFLLFNMNKSYWADSTIISSIFDIPLNLLIYMLVFFILGFFIYAFMFGAIGSTASKLEDINTSTMPVTLLFVIGFMVVIYSMTGGGVDSMLMKVCSYVPFTSPMAMFTRIAMSTVPFYEVALSIAVLILSTAGIGVLAAKIYRVGVLLYGTTPKIFSVLKSVLRA